jgi:putative addiction module component (TIGR02574 family)
MLADLKTFEAEALTLPVSQRVFLAQHLLASLDEVNELDIRLAEHEQNPGDVSSWDEVRSRLWRTL